MPTPQPGVFALGSRAHHHLEFDRRPADRGPHGERGGTAGGPAGDVAFGAGRSGPDGAGIIEAVARIRDAATTIVGVNVVVGFGPDLWRTLAPEHVPLDGRGELGGFTAIEGPDGFTIPAAQHDLWIWVHGGDPDALFDLARLAAAALAGSFELVAEQFSFTYRASLDLTGFEDGTENPALDEAVSVATIGDGEPCPGGSVALLQRWVHDLDGFDALDVPAREQVVGRTLDGSVELDDDVRSPRSHISRVVIEDDAGEELEVFRRSAAFGGVREHGLMFLAFSSDRDRLARMLDRMAGIGDGVRDHLTEFSTPTASAWYVVPPVELLRALGG